MRVEPGQKCHGQGLAGGMANKTTLYTFISAELDFWRLGSCSIELSCQPKARCMCQSLEELLQHEVGCGAGQLLN